MKPSVLYEDSEVIAVAKESGELVHNSIYAGPRETSLRERVIAAIQTPVFPLHRLDRGTSGVVLFAKDRARVAEWNHALASSRKRYIALVRGHFFGAAWVDHPITDPDGGAKEAQTAIAALSRSRTERMSVVQLLLVTGRTHQARRHLKHLHHPIIGDVKYGKGPFNRLARERYGLDRLGLHAVELQIPAKGIRIVAPLPTTLNKAGRAIFGQDWDLVAAVAC